MFIDGVAANEVESLQRLGVSSVDTAAESER
jgi:hypothetical protein